MGETVEVQPLAIVADELGGRPVVTASITDEAVAELKLAKGPGRVRRRPGDRRDVRPRLTRFRRSEATGLAEHHPPRGSRGGRSSRTSYRRLPGIAFRPGQARRSPLGSIEKAGAKRAARLRRIGTWKSHAIVDHARACACFAQCRPNSCAGRERGRGGRGSRMELTDAVSAARSICKRADRTRGVELLPQRRV